MDWKKVSAIVKTAEERIKTRHISCFADDEHPLFLISEQYAGIWMEHVYDSVILAKNDRTYLPLAQNAILLFVERQKENGQLPYCVLDPQKLPELPPERMVGYWQIQECVSFLSLALEVYEMNQDPDYLSTVYEAGVRWNNWFRTYRMTTNRGLIELFVGYDTGHDNSGRLERIGCKGNYRIDDIPQTADVLPPDDGITPILAVDMNCTFYADEKALEQMARILKRENEAQAWANSAKRIKEKLFEHCYDKEDDFFYDVDRNGKKRKYRSCALLHLFMEHVLDPETDKELIARIYRKYLKNPDAFWTPYPFPSMALSDPSVQGHPDFNCWGYYTQGLTVLRCARWMDDYGWSADYDFLLSKWIEAWTTHYDTIKLAQELDPLTGIPTRSSEWYSSTMLSYIYGAKRLKKALHR